MDSMTAFVLGESARARGDQPRVFDWDEAARRIVAAKATHASAGLSGDWDWTGGEILADGKPVPAEDTYTYLASIWAIPELALGEGDWSAGDDCWRWKDETPGWDSDTYWPQSALDILNGDVIEGEVVMRELEA